MGKVLGGILGGGSPAPTPAPVIVRERAPQKKAPTPQSTDAVADAKRRAAAAKKRTGRSALRIDLADNRTATRGGVSLNA